MAPPIKLISKQPRRVPGAGYCDMPWVVDYLGADGRKHTIGAETCAAAKRWMADAQREIDAAKPDRAPVRQQLSASLAMVEA